MGLGIDVKKLRKGDVVESRRTMQVADVTISGRVYLEDVQSRQRFSISPIDAESTLKINVILQAKTKPQSGDVLTGDEIVAREWKSGTVVESVRNPGDLYVLQGDGRWASSFSSGTSVTIPHRDMFGTWQGKLRYVA
jgi:hypothetical protein